MMNKQLAILLLWVPASVWGQNCPAGMTALPLNAGGGDPSSSRQILCKDASGRIASTLDFVGQTRNPSAFGGADMGAKIQAAIDSLGTPAFGTLEVRENGTIGNTIHIPANSAVAIRGAGRDNIKLMWSGEPGGTMFDSTETSNFQVRDLHLDGANKAGTAIRTSAGPKQRYFDQFVDLQIRRFGGTVIDMGMGNSTSDSVLYDVMILGGTKGIVTSRQNINCYFCDIQSQATSGIEIGGNGKVSFFGGHFSSNAFDVRVSGAGAEFFGTWFENSGGILTAVGAPNLLSPLGFYNCWLHASGTANLIDATNMTGSIILVGNRVGPHSGSTNVVLGPGMKDNLIRSNVGLTFAGSSDWATAIEPHGLTVLATGASGDFFRLSDSSGGSNPSKWFRVKSGCLEILNDAQTRTIGQLCDGGAFGVAGSLNAPHLSIGQGVADDGGGLKHARLPVTNCPGAGCSVTWTFTTPFPDQNYTPVCTVVDGSATSKNAGLRLAKIRGKTNAAITVDLDNLSAAPLTGAVSCIALHD